MKILVGLAKLEILSRDLLICGVHFEQTVKRLSAPTYSKSGDNGPCTFIWQQET
jgi:hypothetical protein